MASPRVVSILCAVLACASAAFAQGRSTATDAAGPEITPYVFMGSNASSGIGAAVRWPLPGDFSVELETAYRRSQAASLSSSVNLLYDLPSVGRVTPYVAAGIGLDQYLTAYVSPAGIVPLAGTALAVNAGGGLRIRAGDRWGIRSDARWQNGLGRSAPERWRLYNGVTLRPMGQ
jgi:hypothetical protein